MNKLQWRNIKHDDTGLNYIVSRCDDMDWEYVIEEFKIDSGGSIYRSYVSYNEYDPPLDFAKRIVFSTQEEAKKACEIHYLFFQTS